jgi:glutamate synthase (NADPH/NADH) large chain
MTNGVVIVLGKTGVNFGAGMSGGFAIVLDEDGSFKNKYNKELVDTIKIDRTKNSYQENFLRSSISDYVEKTDSEWGKHILENYEAFIEKFLIVKPKAINIEEILNKDSVAA